MKRRNHLSEGLEEKYPMSSFLNPSLEKRGRANQGEDAEKGGSFRGGSKGGKRPQPKRVVTRRENGDYRGGEKKENSLRKYIGNLSTKANSS